MRSTVVQPPDLNDPTGSSATPGAGTDCREPPLLSLLAPRPVLAGVAGACCIAFSAVLVRLAGVEPATAAVFRCLYALPLLGLLMRSEDRRLGPRPRRARLLAAGAGIFFAIDLVTWHHAIAAVGAGLATVLGNLQVVVVGLLAWALLGERLSRRLLLGIPILLLGVTLISGVLGGSTYGAHPGLGVVLGILTSLAYAGFLLVLRQGASDLRRPAGPLFDATAVAVVVAAGLGPLTGGIDLVPSWPAHGWLLLLAVSSQVVGWLLISVSLPRLPAALTSVLLLLQPVSAVALGVVLLREAPSAGQLVGVGLILLGVVVATTGRGSRGARGDTPAGFPAGSSAGSSATASARGRNI